MPHIDVTMFPGRDPETKQKLAEKLAQTLIETLQVDEAVVSVSVEDVQKEDWPTHIQQYDKDDILVKAAYMK